MRREFLGFGVIFLLFFLFGTNIAATNNYPTQGICQNNSPALISINEIPLIIVSLIALSISLDVIAIGYIVGKLVPGTQLSSWVRKEYWEVAKSAMLIAGIYAILIFLGSLSTGLVGVNPVGTSLGAPFAALTTASQAYLSGIFCGQAVTQQSTTVSWNWGDLQSSFGTSVNHQYDAPGPYTITATIQNSNGDKVSVSKDIVVDTGTTPHTFASGSSSGLGMQIAFSGTNTGLSASAQAFTSQGGTGGSDYVSYLIALSEGVGFLQGTTIGYYIPIFTPGISFTLGTQFVPYKNTLLLNNVGDAKNYENLINDVLTLIILPTYTIIGMEYYLLPMFVFSGLAFLIPMGIIFRAMPFLRGIGGTLFAIGIGIAVVLPTTLILVNLPVTSMITPYLLTQPSSVPQSSIFGLNPSNLPGFPAAAGAGDAFASFGSIYPALNGIVGFSIFCVVQFMLFILDLMITFPLVEALAKSLGGTINVEFGRFRIK